MSLDSDTTNESICYSFVVMTIESLLLASMLLHLSNWPHTDWTPLMMMMMMMQRRPWLSVVKRHRYWNIEIEQRTFFSLHEFVVSMVAFLSSHGWNSAFTRIIHSHSSVRFVDIAAADWSTTLTRSDHRILCLNHNVVLGTRLSYGPQHDAFSVPQRAIPNSVKFANSRDAHAS